MRESDAEGTDMVGTNTDTLRYVSYMTYEKRTNKEPLSITSDITCLEINPPTSGKL